jgi:hypothetical protein
MLSSVWARSCIWIGVSIPHQIPVHRSRWISWAFDTRVNQPLRYCYILAPESVLHIPVDYYLSVHNSGKILHKEIEKTETKNHFLSLNTSKNE